MTNADLPALKAIMQDPITMEAYNGAFSDEEVAVWLERQLLSYKQHGHGLWAVVQRTSGVMLGQCGLTYQPINGATVVEVGYLFNRDYWHQGYAIEASRACVDWAFTHLTTNTVYAQVRDTNIASMNVAIRLGMTIRSRFIKQYRGVAMPHYAFAVTATTETHTTE